MAEKVFKTYKEQRIHFPIICAPLEGQGFYLIPACFKFHVAIFSCCFIAFCKVCEKLIP